MYKTLVLLPKKIYNCIQFPQSKESDVGRSQWTRGIMVKQESGLIETIFVGSRKFDG